MVEYTYNSMSQRKIWSGEVLGLCMCGGGSMDRPGVGSLENVVNYS
jgi:hypothetical protein